MNNDVFQVSGDRVTAFGKQMPPLKEQTVEYYVQNQRPEKSTVPDLQNRGLILEPIQFCTLPVNDIPSNAPMVGQSTLGTATRKLTQSQFKALHEAVGSSVGWWPLTDKSFDFKAFFSGMELYMLSTANGKPIGMGCLRRNYGGNPGQTGLAFFGIIASEQGKGYGSAFLKNILDKAWDGNTKAVSLSTAPETDMMAGKGHANAKSTSQLYINCGFALTDSHQIHPKDCDPLNLDMLDLGIKDYYKAEVDHAGYNPDTDLANFYETKLSLAFTRPKALKLG